MTLFFFFTLAQPDKQKVLNRGSPNLWIVASQKLQAQVGKFSYL